MPAGYLLAIVQSKLPLSQNLIFITPVVVMYFVTAMYPLKVMTRLIAFRLPWDRCVKKRCDHRKQLIGAFRERNASSARENYKLGTWGAGKITGHIVAEPLLNDSLKC